MENIYTEKDDYGRELAINFFKKVEFTKSTDPISSWDLSGSTLNGDFYSEVKVRDIKSDTYSTSFLEYKKLVGLKNVAGKDNMNYMVFYTDGILMVFDLKKIKLSEVYLSIVDCPISSTENKGYVSKLMIEIPTQLAKKYKY